MYILRSLAVILPLSFGLLPSSPNGDPTPVHVVLFTHIEDNTPGGTLGTTQNRNNYLLYRERLIELGNLALTNGIPWTLQPDWKIQRAALLYENDSLKATTNNKNFLRYLKEDLGVVIDPHSHEGMGYNYTDVAHLLDSLGVGATTVIGGHVWDPDLEEFQEWDRFRVPVAGQTYPWSVWRGDILMGSGTPNHVNDPMVSGVWRPRDREHYFQHDPTGNIVAIGQYKGTIEGIDELNQLYETGAVSPSCMLTTSLSIRPVTITSPTGMATIQDSIFTPVDDLRDAGLIVPTDFTTLVETWQSDFGELGWLYDPEAGTGAAPPPISAAASIRGFAPNPFRGQAIVEFSVSRIARVRIAVSDVQGREVALLVDEEKEPGEYSVGWKPGEAASGVYVCRLKVEDSEAGSLTFSRKIVLVR